EAMGGAAEGGLAGETAGQLEKLVAYETRDLELDPPRLRRVDEAPLLFVEAHLSELGTDDLFDHERAAVVVRDAGAVAAADRRSLGARVRRTRALVPFGIGDRCGKARRLPVPPPCYRARP